MATQSILKNITITEPTAAEIFISAMEKAAEASEIAETSGSFDIVAEDLSKDELKKYSGRINIEAKILKTSICWTG